MKKYLVVCAAALMMLPCFPLLSQEADEPGPGVEFTIIPRLDLSYEESELALGNSSLYSLFEGNITENLSFSLCNHWTSLYLDDKALAFDTSWSSLIDWAYLQYDLGNFYVQLGRFDLFSEGFEGYQDDWDIHPILCSRIWNSFDMYQWGGNIAWHNESESTTLLLQMVTSPYGDPFTSGLYSFGARWIGEYDFASTLWSFSAINTGNGYYQLVSLGQSFNIGESLSLTIDYSNAVGDDTAVLVKGHTAFGELAWSPIESLTIAAKGGYEYASDALFKDTISGYSAGAYVNWFPIENLRLHAAAGYNNSLGGFSALGGIMYNLCFSTR